MKISTEAKRILLTIDIETESITDNKEDALSEFNNRITVIGVYNHTTKSYSVYRDLNKFQNEIWNNEGYIFNGHNLKFDLRNLIHHVGPIDLERYEDDTRLMAFILTEKIPQSYLVQYNEQRLALNKALPHGISHREASLHSLKTLAPYFLGVAPFWENPASHDSDEYVLKDVEYTQRLYYELKARLENANQYNFYKNKLIPWTRMILKAELEGVTLDVEATRTLQAHCENEVERINMLLSQTWAEHYAAWADVQRSELLANYTQMFNEAVAKKPQHEVRLRERYTQLYEKALPKLDNALSLESPKQLAWLLKERLQLDIRNLEGKESTDKEVLNRLGRQNDDVKLLVELRQNVKLATAFLPKYLANMRNGKLHTNFNMDGTRTGRLSSSGSYNAQQHPRDLKYLFKAGENEKLITYDLAAIEPLVIAYYTDDKNLTDIVSQGRSLHDYNTINMFNLDCPESEVKSKYPDLRSAAKELGLACLYGSGYNQVRISCQKRGINKTEKECKEIVKRIRESFSEVWDFKSQLDEVFENGEVIYNLLGRPLKISDPSDVYMKAFNTLVQSSASDLTLQIGYNISKIKGCTPILFIHDSVVTRVKLDEIEYPIEVIEQMIKKEFTKFELKNSICKLDLMAEGGVSDVWE